MKIHSKSIYQLLISLTSHQINSMAVYTSPQSQQLAYITKLAQTILQNRPQKTFQKMQITDKIILQITYQWTKNTFKSQLEIMYASGQPVSVIPFYGEQLCSLYAKTPMQIENKVIFRVDSQNQSIKSIKKINFQKAINLDQFTNILCSIRGDFKKCSLAFVNILIEENLIKRRRRNYKISKRVQHLKYDIINLLKHPKGMSEQQSVNEASAHKNLSQIQVLKLDGTKHNIRKGGFAHIEIKSVQYLKEGELQKKKDILACKMAKDTTYRQKIRNQLEIIKQLQGNSYLLNYYQDKRQQDVIYMQYLPCTLKQYLTHQYKRIIELITLATSIAEAVVSLKGVVHRDLNPSNILFNTIDFQVKIIDFGQSRIINSRSKGQKQKIGSTIPYSPPECDQPHVENDNGQQVGYSSASIDSWSLGVILFEIFFGKKPMSYSDWLRKDILNNWKKQFLLCLSTQKRPLNKIIQDIITIICIKTIRMNPSQRMPVRTIYNILKRTKEYLYSYYD